MQLDRGGWFAAGWRRPGLLISGGTISVGSYLRAVDIQGGHFLHTLSAPTPGPEEQASSCPLVLRAGLLAWPCPYPQRHPLTSFLHSRQAALDAIFPWLAAAPCRVCAPRPRKVWLAWGTLKAWNWAGRMVALWLKALGVWSPHKGGRREPTPVSSDLQRHTYLHMQQG